MEFISLLKGQEPLGEIIGIEFSEEGTTLQPLDVGLSVPSTTILRKLWKTSS